MVGHGKFSRPVPDDGPVRYHKWYYPWGYAAAINFVIFWIFLATAELRIVYGDRQAPSAVPVIVLSEAVLAPAPPEPEELVVPLEVIEPEPAIPEPEVAIPVPEPVVEEIAPEPIPDQPPAPAPLPEADVFIEPEPEPLQEPEPEIEIVETFEPYVPPPEPEPIDYSNLTGPEIDELYRQRTALPDIELPDVSGDGSSGVVAIFCPDEFDDPDKAAECAGRTEILSGWTRTDEDWSGITSSLRRGGLNVPDEEPQGYGPRGRIPLAENEQYYEEKDLGLVVGRDTARAIENARGYQQLKQASFGTEATTNQTAQALDNLGGEVTCYASGCENWEPSWTIVQDPNIDTDTVERIMREADSEE